ncbi:hypothetical protein OIO90_006042 [Microbotryomycetes sp. JL221]|nr:hypothetical protein OIO90_006042 [Microbotryomycetes sp. JL221]
MDVASDDDLPPPFRPVLYSSSSPPSTGSPILSSHFRTSSSPVRAPFSRPRKIMDSQDVCTIARHMSTAITTYEARSRLLTQAVEVQRATDGREESALNTYFVDAESEKWKKRGQVAASYLFETVHASDLKATSMADTLKSIDLDPSLLGWYEDVGFFV